MKYEEIKIGDVFTFLDYKMTVISKSDEHKVITTVNCHENFSTWRENELHVLEPLKEQLPEEGVLVNDFGSLVYKLPDGSGYGFAFGNQSDYLFNKHWGFDADGLWKPATEEQEKKFVEMLKIECESRGLYEDTKIENHADGTSLTFPDRLEYEPAFNSEKAWNKNGQIFYKGKFATPRKEETLKLVSKAVKEINNFLIEQTKSGIIILTPIKK